MNSELCSREQITRDHCVYVLSVNTAVFQLLFAERKGVSLTQPVKKRWIQGGLL